MKEALLLLGTFVFVIVSGLLIVKSKAADDVWKFVGAFAIAGGMIGLLTIPFILAVM